MSLILVVDDDEDLRATIESIIGNAIPDTSILHAGNATEAIAIAAHRRPNLIIVDYFMPGMTGVGLSQIISQSHDIKRVPVIMLTNVDNEQMKRFGIQNGVSVWLVKPVVPKVLVATIRRLLRNTAG